ncbi:MAG: hypothetical protein KIT09_27280 [Bryobacteraceae bacterium]|nr:hypothetical protein [Bryobacteraceae bacterium]
MYQTSDSAGAMLARLCLFGPVIYAALLMVVDPAKIVALLSRAASRLSSLESHQWAKPSRDAESFPASPGMELFVRFAGVALALFGLLHLIGLVPPSH